MLNSIDVIVFDFDGVITIRGELLKREAWDVIAEKESDAFKQKLSEMQTRYAEGRGSRHDILRDAFTELGYSASQIPTLVAEWANRYNTAVQKMIFSDGIYPETPIALEKLAAQYPLYINSATPEIALEESVKRLGIRHFFKGAFGQPISKKENLQRILQKENILPAQLLFVGDSNGDQRAGATVGCQFVGIANEANQWSEKTFPVIHRLTELEGLLFNLK